MPDPIDSATAHLIRWGEAHDLVRAMLLTSTRAVPGAHVDRLFNYVATIKHLPPPGGE
ncbi:MAG: hypothetical protein JXC32_06370 [Anaerolineae bacterium]|nr:hypothetical protein [Anaerolineae bacterium]